MFGLRRLRRSAEYVRNRAEGKSLRSPMFTGQQQELRNSFTSWMQQPEKGIAPIQDLDPTSATFGDVFWMLDFDALE